MFKWLQNFTALLTFSKVLFGKNNYEFNQWGFFIGGYNWKKFNVIMNQLKWTKDNSSYFTDEINRNLKKLEFSDEINRRLIICTVTTFHVILRVYHQNCLLIVYNLRHVHDSQTTCKHTKAWRLWLLLMIFFIQTNTSLLQKRS